MKVWMVTGASRGFGLEIARQALDAGDDVVALARDDAVVRRALGDHPRLLACPADVTDDASVHRAVGAAVERFGRIDVLVNNAGHGIVGAVEEVSDAETRSVFEVNVFGVLAVTRAVLPLMRDQGSGHVVMMSSMGGVSQPGSGWGVYGASKFAVEGFSEALSHEVRDLGIAVTLVEPGVFRTDFLDSSSLQEAETRIDAYAATSGLTRTGALERNHQQQGDPVKGAAAVRAVVHQDDPPLRLPLGADAVAAIESKLDAVRADLERTRDLAVGTAHGTD